MCFRICKLFDNKKWWLAGGIPASACVAAYQPKGASDYAASKVNLANPGVYDAVDGADVPTWSTVSGWTSDGTIAKQLVTTIKPTYNYSLIVRLPRGTGYGDFFIGCCVNSTTALTLGYQNTPKPAFWSGSQYLFGSHTTSNLVIAVCGRNAYFQGQYSMTASAGNDPNGTAALTICGNSVHGRGLHGSILACAVYNVVLTDTQVAAVTAAMNAL